MIDRLTLNLNETECNPLQNLQSFKNHLKKCLSKRIQKTSTRKLGRTAKIGAAQRKHDEQPNCYKPSSVQSMSARIARQIPRKRKNTDC